VEPSAPPLTREALASVLGQAGVAPTTYHLYGAHINDAVILDHRAVGWVVFYSERGGEFSLRRHGTEDAACRDLLARLGVRC
jgi:hypothetical protein